MNWQVIIHSTDGGASWQQRSYVADNLVLKSAFAYGSNVWAVGEEGMIYISNDRGVSWSGGVTTHATCASHCASQCSGGQVNCVWRAVASQDSSVHSSLICLDGLIVQQVVYIAGDAGCWLKSTDSGGNVSHS